VQLLRAGVLAGVRAVVAGPAGPVAERLVALGAAVRPVAVGEEELDGAALAPLDVLVWDAGAAFAAAGGGVGAVRAALDGAWLAVRPVAAGAWIAGGAGGLVVLLAPPPGDAHAAAARAGLENLARTLSIEWARFAIRPVAVLPGARTSAGEVAELVAYLASPAGAYYAGCALTLGAAED
jgi:citronellol/citronellal dehydrogenase